MEDQNKAQCSTEQQAEASLELSESEVYNCLERKDLLSGVKWKIEAQREQPYYKIIFNNSNPIAVKWESDVPLNKQNGCLNNSCVWCRVYSEDSELKEIKKEFSFFKSIGLYDYSSEYIKYHASIMEQNILQGNDHSQYVTPNVYGDEREFLKELQEIKLSEDDGGNHARFKLLNLFHNVSMRILVVDDKICGGEFRNVSNTQNQPVVINSCAACKGKNGEKPCKLFTLKELLRCKNEDLFPEGEGEDKYFYWKRNAIDLFHVETIIKDFHEENALNERIYVQDSVLDKDAKIGENELRVVVNSGDLLKKKQKENMSVQIVGVKDVRTALLLLSKYKFDILFFDYLLDYRTEEEKNKGDARERDLSIPFFEFLSNKQTNIAPLNKLRRDVLDNRGPLDRFWIMPITAFNQPFISDLLNHKVRLIDHRWNISHGADPINTPWQFLYALNHFIDLQLRSSVFTSKQLLTFLQYTGEELEEHIIKKDKDAVDFNEFQFFMGSEYASFMRHYGNMRLIQYDADTTKRSGEKNKVLSNKSLFSTYVWENFYNNDEFVPLLGLNRKMRTFYYTAAFMPNDSNGRKRLREAFYDLRYTIDLENLVQKSEVEEKDFETAIKNISDALNALD